MQPEPIVLESWLDALASGSPAPGGGAAAALCGATAASLTSMVANFTVGRPKYAAVADEAQSVLQQSEALRATLTHLMAEDAAAFATVATAYRLPKATADEQQLRTEAITSALLIATDVPLRIAEAAQQVIQLAVTIARIGNGTVITDAGAAALLGQAAAQAALLNVMVNVQQLSTTTTVDYLIQRQENISTGVESLTSTALAIVKDRLHRA